jgi:hypothetical protein
MPVSRKGWAYVWNRPLVSLLRRRPPKTSEPTSADNGNSVKLHSRMYAGMFVSTRHEPNIFALYYFCG